MRTRYVHNLSLTVQTSEGLWKGDGEQKDASLSVSHTNYPN